MPAFPGTGILSVLDYGARGDGTSDDTAAIQRAVDAASGSTLWFPSGVYRVTRQITATASRVEFRGDAGTRLLFSAAGARFLVNGASTVRFVNFELDGNQYANRSECLTFIRCHEVEVADCYLHHSWNNGISVDSNNATIGSADNTDVRVVRCRFAYTGDAADTTFTPHSQGCGIWMTGTTGFVIADNTFTQTAGDGAIFLAGPCSEGVITHNLVDNTWWRGIELYQNVSATTISQNVILHTGGANTGSSGVGCNGIFLDDVTAPGTVLIDHNQVQFTGENGIEGGAIITGNVINTTGAYPHLATPSIEGIYLESYGVAIGNYIYHSGGDGIKLDGNVQNFSVTGNTVINASQRQKGYSGIHVQAQGGPSAHIANGLVSANLVVDTQANMQYGILVENSGDGSSVDSQTLLIGDNQVAGIAGGNHLSP